MSDHNAQAEVITSENSLPANDISMPSSTSSVTPIPDAIEQSIQETTNLTPSEMMAITSSTALLPQNVIESNEFDHENELIISPDATATSQEMEIDGKYFKFDFVQRFLLNSFKFSIFLEPSTPKSTILLPADSSSVMDVSMSLSVSNELQIPGAITPTSTSPAINIVDGDLMLNASVSTTPSVPKERKRRIVVDDDDESPTFNPLSRSSKKMRGKNRKNRVGLSKQKQRKLLLLGTPDGKANESAIFTSPDSIVSTSNLIN